MPATKLINKVYHAIAALKIATNNEQSLKMLQEFEGQEGLCHYIGYEAEEVAKAIEELPVSYFNLCLREPIPMGGFGGYSLSMALAMHIITMALEQEFTCVEEYIRFMQNIFTPLAYNEV